jgi:predicted MFS family arabinose efflux permease
MPPQRFLIPLLGITEAISWGTLYFVFTVLIEPMRTTLGWSKPFLAGGYSLGLLVWALCSFGVGRLLERLPARRVMATGSLLAAIGLFGWAHVDSQAAFLLLALPIGVAMATTLYEPAFVVLRQVYGDGYRKPIMWVTLVAGFASTVFIPLAQWLVLLVGWRHTLLAFAALNLLVCVPLHASMTVRPVALDAGAAAAQAAERVQMSAWRMVRAQPVFWLVVTAFVAHITVASVIGAHLIPLLSERGEPLDRQLWIAALIGPAQVVGRVAMIRLRASRPMRLALFVYATMAVGLVVLATAHGPALLLFAVLFGGPNGVGTMLRAMAMPEMISRHHYATLNGLMMTPVLLAQAAAPWLAALLWKATGGYAAVCWLMVALVLYALAAWFVALQRRGLLRAPAAP